MRRRIAVALVGPLALAALLCGIRPAVAQAGFALGPAFRGAVAPMVAVPSLAVSPLAAPDGLCGQAVAAAERSTFVPPRVLGAIASVESGRRDPASGRFAPWPWTINAEGQGYFFETKAQAIAAVREMQAHGIRSIDVGCMQVNLMHHPDAFPSLEAAFDPQINAAWAARFLTGLFGQTGNWERAVGLYHSATPELAADYQRRVQAALAGYPPGAAGVGGGAFAGSSGPVWAALPGGGQGATPPQGGGLVHVAQTLLAPRHVDALRVMLRPSDAPPGRGLAAYRAAPVGAVVRPWRVQGGG